MLGRLDAAVGDGAHAVDGGNEHITRRQESRRFAGRANSTRCAGEDDIARVQLDDARQIGHELRNVEDEIVAVGLLNDVAVERAGERESVALCQA